MSEDNRLSRRQSLLGIGATGATLAGLAGCLGSDEAATGTGSDDETDRSTGNGDENGDGTGKKGRLALEFVCHGSGEAQLRVRNKATEKVAVEWKVTVEDLDRAALEDLLDDLNGELDDADRSDVEELETYLEERGFGDVSVDDLEGKRISLEGTTLSIGEKEVDLKALAAKEGIDVDGETGALEKFSGTLTVPKGADESFWAGVLTEGTNVELYYDGKKVDAVDIDASSCEHETDGEGAEIDVESVCYRYREIDFAELDETQLANTYDSDITGVTEEFDPDGEVIVNGKTVDEGDYADLPSLDDGTDVLAESDFAGTDDLAGLEGVATVREATFRVRNRGKRQVKVGWTVEGDGQGGKLVVDGGDSATFRVIEHNDRKTFVTVTANGEEVASVKPADTECTESHDHDA